jgi:hypothetical protein
MVVVIGVKLWRELRGANKCRWLYRGWLRL